ncbi:MAG TPA: NADP-dependent oxidoreductase [Stellaceae bacterium]|nr:NADP-dependent oxidoreductase [Stellaceae bacterium]
MNRQILLKSRPAAMPATENFSLVERPIPEPAARQFLVRHLWMSLDPYMRGRMSDAKSYAKPVGIGEVMAAGTVGEVVRSRHDGFAAGDIVQLYGGWQDYAVSNGAGAVKLDRAAAPIQYALGVLGMPGMTAYCGLLEIGRPKPGETVVVAAASGAVGSVVGQIARIKGARAVGIAGGERKVAHVKDTLGFDDCVDHRGPDLAAALAHACPNGIDVYFENVGGAVQDAVWPLLNDFARVPLCGLISQYSEATPRPGPAFVSILRKRLTVRGFIVTDFAAKAPEFRRDVAAWLAEGRIKYQEDVVEGLERAPEAFIGLLQGRNFGKLLVKLA